MRTSQQIINDLTKQMENSTAPMCDSCNADVEVVQEGGVSLFNVFHDPDCPVLAEHNHRIMNRKQRREAKRNGK